MKLVIEIDKDLYEKYKDNYYADNYISSSNIERTFSAIAHGTPLTSDTDCINCVDDICFFAGKYIDYGACVCLGYKPKTEPTRPKAKWIIDDKEYSRIWHCHCSKCKKDPQDHIGGSEDWWLVRLPNYCPNCGAEMESE